MKHRESEFCQDVSFNLLGKFVDFPIDPGVKRVCNTIHIWE